MRHLTALVAASLALALACGCASPRPSVDTVQALALADQARQQALLMADSPERQQLVASLDRLTASLGGDPTSRTAVIAASSWYEQFRPVKVSISYFTEMADFDGDGQYDGVDVRLSLEDQFGDAVKALGDFRVELFSHLPRETNPRGQQLANWFVSVRTAEDLQLYWDSTDRAFHFPLSMKNAVDAGRVIVQVTYYLPDGSDRMLFGERIIRLGQ